MAWGVEEAIATSVIMSSVGYSGSNEEVPSISEFHIVSPDSYVSIKRPVKLDLIGQVQRGNR